MESNLLCYFCFTFIIWARLACLFYNKKRKRRGKKIYFWKM